MWPLHRLLCSGRLQLTLSQLLLWIILTKPFFLNELNILAIISEATLLLLFCLLALFVKQWPDSTAKSLGEHDSD